MLAEADGIETQFKHTSTVAQSLAKNCDKELTQHRLRELRRLKERLVRLRKDAVSRQKLLLDILPAVKSLSSGLAKLSVWLSEAYNMLASHRISGEHLAVAERMNKHKVSFIFVLSLKYGCLNGCVLCSLCSD